MKINKPDLIENKQKKNVLVVCCLVLKVNSRFTTVSEHACVSNDARSNASQKKCISTGGRGMHGWTLVLGEGWVGRLMSSPQFCKVSGVENSQALMHSFLVCVREAGGPLDSCLPLINCFIFFTVIGSCEYF